MRDGPALRHLVEAVVGGAWGNEQDEGEVNAQCVRGTDFDTATLMVRSQSAPVRGFGRTELQSRLLLDGDLIIEKSGGGENQPVGRVVQWLGDDLAVPTNFAARLRPRRDMNRVRLFWRDYATAGRVSLA